MNFVNVPPFSDMVLYTYVFYIILCLIVFKIESSGTFNLPYSKFAGIQGISPRLGMFFIYFIPMVAYYLTWDRPDNPKTIYQYITLIMFMVHFGKRCLEVLFLHKFSGKIGWLGVFLITFAYSNIGVLTGSLHNQVLHSSIKSAPVWWTGFGIIVFIIGQTGNFYHHILLSSLRTDDQDKTYKIPTKGMFDKVVCPHYLFELISWLGFAIVSTHLDTYFVFLIMASYLSGRSHRTREWYYAKLPDYPKSKSRIIPGLY